MLIDPNKPKVKPEEKYGVGESLINRTNNSEDRSKLDLAGMFDESKMKRYQLAMEKKAILMDKEGEDGVDYTHFDFVLSTGCGFYEGMTNFQALKLFWKALYPYFKNIILNYEGFYERFRDMIDDQEEVLRNHAELDYKYKWTVQYLKSIGHKDKFNGFVRQQIAEMKKKHKGKSKDCPSNELPDLIIE